MAVRVRPVSRRIHGTLVVLALIFAMAPGVPAGAETASGTGESSPSGITPRHISPVDCDDMGAFLRVDEVELYDGTGTNLLATADVSIGQGLPLISDGDILKVTKAHIENIVNANVPVDAPCDVSNGEAWLAIPDPAAPAAGGHIGGSESKVYTGDIAFGANPVAVAPLPYTYTTNRAVDEFGDGSVRIDGIVDAGLDPFNPPIGQVPVAAGLLCGNSGILHLAENESGVGCSRAVVGYFYGDPAIEVHKRALLWDGVSTLLVGFDNGVPVYGPPEIEEGTSVEPGTEVTYIYAVKNTGPFALTHVDDSDTECGPIVEAVNGNGRNIGDFGQDDVFGSGEIWFYYCMQTVDLPNGLANTIIINTVEFTFGDRNANPAVDDDDFTLYVGYTCLGLLADIIGTAGDDIIGDDEDVSGDNVIVTFGGNDTVDAGDGNDTLCLGPGDNIGNGGRGRDKIFGEEDNDTLNGEQGIDRVEGGPGDNEINGSGGGDLLNGDDGDDRIYGSKGKDRINGGDGNDVLYGMDRADTINGDAGRDRIIGGQSSDILNGGDGPDNMFGNIGNDTLNGGAGNDRLNGGAGPADTADGGDDFDVCVAETELNCEK